MGLLDWLGWGHSVPTKLLGSSLLVCDNSTYRRAAPFLAALQQRFNNIALAFTDRQPDDNLPYPAWQLPSDMTQCIERIKKIQPQRLIFLGADERFMALLPATSSPISWINAQNTTLNDSTCRLITTAMPIDGLHRAQITGDPLSGITNLPAIQADTTICTRFKEQREGKRWLAYFAGTGESEEPLAYQLFNRAIRHQMGVMILAPQDAARYEPVYRDALKYRLQTIRHNRLSTSFVPIRTRVYYVEGSDIMTKLYACADFVIIGGTLHNDAQHQPDVITPMLYHKPVLVGPAHSNHPAVAAALAAGVARQGRDETELFNIMQQWIDDPASREQQAMQAQEWLLHQPGALNRVADLIP